MATIPDSLSGEITQRFHIHEENTFQREVKQHPRDRIDIEVGDSKQLDFKPQVKIMRWENEVNFSLRAKEDPTATVETAGKVIKYITADYEVHQYEKPDAGEDGGFEFEWVLPKKPETNILEATIKTKELDFFYQPALTPEEIEQGVQRSDNVIGSYAVYHKSKSGNYLSGKNYKTGKAFHIFRPKVIDASGSEVWGELHIDVEKELLSVTVPQDFLDKAVYPVVVDPTLGYTSIGASTLSSIASNDIISHTASAPENGTVDSISAYIYRASGTANFKGVLLTSSDENIIANGVGGATNFDTTAQWNISTYSPVPTITSGTSYYIGIIQDTIGDTTLNFDSGATGNGINDTSNSYNNPQDYGTGQQTTNRNHSIYATLDSDIEFLGATEQATSNDATPLSFATSISAEADFIIVKAILVDNTSTTLSSPTWNGVAMSEAVTTEREATTGVFHKITIYYLAAPATGSQTFSVDTGQTTIVSHIIVEAYKGMLQLSPLDQTNTGSGSTDPSTSVTPTEDGELVVDAYLSEANDVLVNASGQIKTHDHDSGGRVSGASYVIQGTAGAQAMTWAGTDEEWTQAVATFKKAAGEPVTGHVDWPSFQSRGFWSPQMT